MTPWDQGPGGAGQEAIYEGIAGAEKHVIAGSGHSTIFDNSEEHNRVVIDFFTAQPGGASLDAPGPANRRHRRLIPEWSPVTGRCLCAPAIVRLRAEPIDAARREIVYKGLSMLGAARGELSSTGIGPSGHPAPLRSRGERSWFP